MSSHYAEAQLVEHQHVDATGDVDLQATAGLLELTVYTSGQPVVLVSPMSRPHLAQLVMRFLPSVPVLSQAEIPTDIRLTAVGNAGVE